MSTIYHQLICQAKHLRWFLYRAKKDSRIVQVGQKKVADWIGVGN